MNLEFDVTLCTAYSLSNQAEVLIPLVDGETFEMYEGHPTVRPVVGHLAELAIAHWSHLEDWDNVKVHMLEHPHSTWQAPNIILVFAGLLTPYESLPAHRIQAKSAHLGNLKKAIKRWQRGYGPIPGTGVKHVSWGDTPQDGMVHLECSLSRPGTGGHMVVVRIFVQ